MNIIYVLGITILLLGGTDSLIEDAKTDKNQQRILLRKLQNFQDTKPLTWNEVLADVLVNKIRIFSFKNEDKENTIKNDAPITKERTVLANFFSQIFVVYKKFIYDAFVGKRPNDEDNVSIGEAPLDPKIENKRQSNDSEEAIKPSEVIFSKGPKSEVELVEPKYHGKITLEASTTTENPGNEVYSTKKEIDVPNLSDFVNPEIKNGHDVNVEIDPGHTDSENPITENNNNPGKVNVDCPDGYVKSDGGNCVINNSKLILAIPNQCPLGYRKDWLGNCRKIFYF